jgi:hypothetical protein
LVPIIPAVFFAVEGVDESRLRGGKFEELGHVSFRSVQNGVSSITYTLSTQYLIVELAREMAEPEKLPQAYAIVTAPIQLVVLFVCGVGGYYYLGSSIAGSTFTQMPFGLALSLVSICIMISILVANHVNALPICQLMHRFMDPIAEGSGSARDWCVWSAVATSTLFACWLVANAVPFFSDFVSLNGASLAPLANYIIPIAAYTRCYWDNQGDEKLRRHLLISKAEWVIIVTEFVLYSVCMVAGTDVAASAIIKKWATYGYPFQCNCEMMWNTCACSAKRPGMEVCYG